MQKSWTERQMVRLNLLLELERLRILFTKSALVWIRLSSVTPGSMDGLHRHDEECQQKNIFLLVEI